MVEDTLKNPTELRHKVLRVAWVVIPVVIFILINYFTYERTLVTVHNLGEAFRDIRYRFDYHPFEYEVSIYLIGILIFAFVILVFNKTLRQTLWVPKIFIHVFGILMLFLIGNLFYLEFSDFNYSLFEIDIDDLQNLIYILWNIAFLGCEMLLLGILQGR